MVGWLIMCVVRRLKKKELRYNNNMLKNNNNNKIKKMVSNYLKVVFGSRGELEVVEWVEGKSFEEIREMGREEFEINKKWLDMEMEDGGEYSEEFCGYSDMKDVGVEYVVNEEESVGYYNENIVKGLIGLDLNDGCNFDKINEIVFDVDGVCFGRKIG